MTTDLWIIFTSVAVLLVGSMTYKMGRLEGYDAGWQDGFTDGEQEVIQS